MKAIGYVTTLVLLAAIGTLAGGATLSWLWQWFVSDTFGIRPLTIMQAAGVSFVITHVRMTNPSKKDERKFDAILLDGFVFIVMKNSLGLSIGYILHLFM